MAPSGLFLATVPNPTAPQFLIAKHTGTAFHQFVRTRLAGVKGAWDTHYSYGSVRALVASFDRNGLTPVETAYSSCLEDYLRRFRMLGLAARCYDLVVNALRLRPLQGHVCLAVRNRPE